MSSDIEKIIKQRVMDLIALSDQLKSKFRNQLPPLFPYILKIKNKIYKFPSNMKIVPCFDPMNPFQDEDQVFIDEWISNDPDNDKFLIQDGESFICMKISNIKKQWEVDGKDTWWYSCDQPGVISSLTERYIKIGPYNRLVKIPLWYRNGYFNESDSRIYSMIPGKNLNGIIRSNSLVTEMFINADHCVSSERTYKLISV